MGAFKIGIIILVLTGMIERRKAISDQDPDVENRSEIWHRTFQTGWWFPVSFRLNKTSLTDFSTVEKMIDSPESNRSTNATQGMFGALLHFLKPILSSIEIELYPKDIPEVNNRKAKSIKLNFSEVIEERSGRRLQHRVNRISVAFADLYRGVASFLSALTSEITTMFLGDKSFRESPYSIGNLKFRKKRKKRLEMMNSYMVHPSANNGPLDTRFIYHEDENRFRSHANPNYKDHTVNSIELNPKKEHYLYVEIPNNLPQHADEYVRSFYNNNNDHHEIALNDNVEKHLGSQQENAQLDKKEYVIPLVVNLIQDKNSSSSKIDNNQNNFKISISLPNDELTSEEEAAFQQVTKISTTTSSPIYYDSNSHRNVYINRRMNAHKEINFKNKTLHLFLVIK